MNFPFLSVVNRNQKIYYELHSSQRKAPKSCSKNLQNGSCKLVFPNSSLEDDLIQFSCISIFYNHSKDFQAHASLSTETINFCFIYFKKQAKRSLQNC